MAFDKFFINSKGWLTGSIRAQLTPAERGVWADLLALANESRFRGVICRAKGIPYTREYLAQYLEIPLELLNTTIYKCVKDENADDPRTRIMIDESGCIVITNWDKYQVSEEEWENKREELKKLRANSTEKSIDTKKRNESALQALVREINKLTLSNVEIKKRLANIGGYHLTDKNEIVDTETGAVVITIENNSVDGITVDNGLQNK